VACRQDYIYFRYPTKTLQLRLRSSSANSDPFNKGYLHRRGGDFTGAYRSLLQKTFDVLIDSFVRDKVGIAEGFLSVALAADLKENLKSLFADRSLHHAGIGNDQLQNHDQSVRGDMIYWLDRSHNDTHENNLFDLMDAFVSYLNETCYTGITGYEFHYALYAEGSFYKKHLDQFRNNGSRQYSMIMYLNADWQQADGGELCIHHNGDHQNISPASGKGVFFRSSELEHEVLMTHKSRMSITGWLKVG
jgi:SM-20-related protein